MKLNDLLNFRTGNKFILTEDFVDKNLGLWNGKKRINTLPKGLVFTIVSTTLNAVSQTLRCKIIRSKKIVEAVYKPNKIDPQYYTLYSYRNDIDENGYASFVLKGIDLVTFLSNAKADIFNVEYYNLTNEFSRK